MSTPLRMVTQMNHVTHEDQQSNERSHTDIKAFANSTLQNKRSFQPRGSCSSNLRSNKNSISTRNILIIKQYNSKELERSTQMARIEREARQPVNTIEAVADTAGEKDRRGHTSIATFTLKKKEENSISRDNLKYPSLASIQQSRSHLRRNDSNLKKPGISMLRQYISRNKNSISAMQTPMDNGRSTMQENSIATLN